MKRFISLFLAVVLLLPAMMFAACNENTPETLATPQNVAVDGNGRVVWSAVDNATGYQLVIDGQRQQETLTKNEYLLPSTNKKVTIAVIAVAKGYKDSNVSETVTFVGKADKPDVPEQLKVAIGGPSEVRAGQTVKLTAKINGTKADVTWSVVEGGEYISVDDKGNVTAKADVKGDKIACIRATSVENKDVFAERQISLLAKTVLTQQMLDDFANNAKVAFEGFLTIDYYSYGSNEHKGTNTLPLHTAMDGEHWYAEYTNSSAGITKEIFFSKDSEGYACQDSVDFANNVQQIRMTENDREITWEQAGLYNSLQGLSLSDFRFDNDTWRWTYVASDYYELTKKIVAAADPYNFVVDDENSFSLLVDEDGVLGVCVESGVDHSLSNIYWAEQRLIAAANTDSSVEVKAIQKYESPLSAELQTNLREAIANMKSLKAYTLDFMQTIYLSGSGGNRQTGFYEIVTPTDCFFRDYTPGKDSEGNKTYKFDEENVYGFRKITDDSYNSYHCAADSIYYVDPDKFDSLDEKTRTLRPDRAYDGSFDNAKPTFDFSEQLFDKVVEQTKYDADKHDVSYNRYFVVADMCNVATTMYYGIGNDVALYGMFASDGIFSGMYDPTSVDVEKINGKYYITRAEFFFYLGNMYGTVEINYGNFVSQDEELTSATTVPEAQAARIGALEVRSVPTDWSTVNVLIKKSDDDENGHDVPVRAANYFAKRLFAGIDNPIPFFGATDCLADTFGFAYETLRARGGEKYTMPCVCIYYDVPLDINYTIDSSMVKIKKLLTDNGFTQNSYGEYVNGNVIVFVSDEGLDLTIYAWNKSITDNGQLGAL